MAFLPQSSTIGSTTTAQPTSSPGVLPTFENEGPAFNNANLKYNPNNEFIFPSVFDAGLHFKEAALAKWYLYYAPHNDPGGISFVYSDNLDGPWTEYQSNPVISRDWPALGSPRPGHVSSADAVWNEEEQKLYMYFHGDNSVTRWATSEDGINFDYGGIAVSNSDAPVTTTESSYARIFRHPDPDSEYTWAMFYMVNEPNDIRKIRLAESFNGEDWTVADDYVVSEPGVNLSGGNLWEWDGQLYVVYHSGAGKIYARTIDETLRDVGTEAAVLFETSGRVAAPYFVTEDGATYMFYEAGARSSTSIAYATFGGV
ncbi:beta-xylosidase [Ilyonectria destructans]|nr:beta-xylosidase [Ilyonectria destructans]